MSGYIEIRNDNNTIQVNDSFENLTLLKKFQISNWGKLGRSWNADITMPEYPSLLCVHNPSADNVGIFYVVASLKENRMSRNVYVETSSGRKPDFLEFFVFGKGNNAPTGSTGLHVYNNDGACIFDSNRKYLNVVQLIHPTKDINDGYDEAGTISLQTGMKHAVCVPAQANHFIADPGFMFRFYCLYLWLGAGTQSVWGKWEKVQSGGIDDDVDIDEYHGVMPIWLDINVTGY